MNERQDPFHDWDAAYVLGALSTDDRLAFEQHLTHCAQCSAAVAELAGVPGLLGKLPAADAIALLEATPGNVRSGERPDEHLRSRQHEPGIVQALAASVRTTKRRTRRRMIGLAAGSATVLLAGGVLLGAVTVPAGFVAGPNATSSPTAERVAMVALPPGTMTANLEVSERAWGTRFDWDCDYNGADWSAVDPQDAVQYSMVVTDAAGTETMVASWAAAGDAAGGLTASSSVPTSDIRTVEIRLAESNIPLTRTTL